MANTIEMAEEALKKVIPKNSETISQWADEWEAELRREGINVVYNRLSKQLGMDSKDFRLVIDSTDIKISIWNSTSLRFLGNILHTYYFTHWKELYLVNVNLGGYLYITSAKNFQDVIIDKLINVNTSYSVFRLLEAEKTKFKIVAG